MEKGGLGAIHISFLWISGSKKRAAPALGRGRRQALELRGFRVLLRTALSRLRVPVEQVSKLLALDHDRIDGAAVEMREAELDRDVGIALLEGFRPARPSLEAADDDAVARVL